MDPPYIDNKRFFIKANQMKNYYIVIAVVCYFSHLHINFRFTFKLHSRLVLE